MSLSALQKFFLPPIIASAAVFSVMTVPLALLGSKQIVINIEQEPVFFGKLRDVATPYVVFTTILSLGAGASIAAFAGWRSSARKSTQYEQQLSQLEENLKQKEELLKEFKLSESRLQISGLTSFLDEQDSLVPTLKVKAVAQPSPVVQRPVTIGTSAFASAQGFAAYSQPTTNTNIPETAPHSEIEELQQQLREMMLQMQTMQTNLQQIPHTNTETKAPESFKIYYDIPSPHNMQV